MDPTPSAKRCVAGDPPADGSAPRLGVRIDKNGGAPDNCAFTNSIFWRNAPIAMRVSSPGALVRAGLGSFGALVASFGDASAQCKEYQVPPAFSIRQSNGFAVTVKVTVDRRGNVSGTANYGYPPKIGRIEVGSFDGRVLDFRIIWSGGGSGTYEGSINNKGKLVGVTRGGGGTARFESIQRFECFG
jgi:hypothetical protein